MKLFSTSESFEKRKTKLERNLLSMEREREREREGEGRVEEVGEEGGQDQVSLSLSRSPFSLITPLSYLVLPSL